MNEFYSTLVELIKETITVLPESELKVAWIEYLDELEKFQRNADTQQQDIL